MGPPPGFSTGLIIRDYKSFPSGYLACAQTVPENWLVDESEWPERLRQQLATQTSLWDLREEHYPILKSLNQNGFPLCWSFSSTKSAMYLRAAMGEPPLVFSPWWVAGKVVNWQSRGYWGAASLKEIAEEGVPVMSLCPSYRSSYDTPEARANAAFHKVSEWYDGTEDRDQNRRIMISAFLLGLAPVLDFNDISHSMCGCCLKSIDPLEVWCDNSWDDTGQYGPKGIYVRKGRAAIPDGIVVPAAEMPSSN